jgi:hypothetical protein
MKQEEVWATTSRSRLEEADRGVFSLLIGTCRVSLAGAGEPTDIVRGGHVFSDRQ